MIKVITTITNIIFMISVFACIIGFIWFAINRACDLYVLHYYGAALMVLGLGVGAGALGLQMYLIKLRDFIK